MDYTNQQRALGVNNLQKHQLHPGCKMLWHLVKVIQAALDIPCPCRSILQCESWYTPGFHFLTRKSNLGNQKRLLSFYHSRKRYFYLISWRPQQEVPHITQVKQWKSRRLQRGWGKDGFGSTKRMCCEQRDHQAKQEYINQAVIPHPLTSPGCSPGQQGSGAVGDHTQHTQWPVLHIWNIHCRNRR